jgi:hypothetical protein
MNASSMDATNNLYHSHHGFHREIEQKLVLSKINYKILHFEGVYGGVAGFDEVEIKSKCDNDEDYFVGYILRR